MNDPCEYRGRQRRYWKKKRTLKISSAEGLVPLVELDKGPVDACYCIGVFPCHTQQGPSQRARSGTHSRGDTVSTLAVFTEWMFAFFIIITVSPLSHKGWVWVEGKKCVTSPVVSSIVSLLSSESLTVCLSV